MATKANLIVDQGTDFSAIIALTDTDDNPFDLNGYTGTAQFRKHYSSANAVSFSVLLNVNSGDVILSLTRQQTDSVQPGRYVYDVELVSSANVARRVIEGIVTITPSVTR